ncbi:DUF2254 domain-containing protein [Corynebacterium sp. 13CS0277]|uniref:DUF2254 domain-containing protein n=1 Tax=Corynebacterium sp. 13CS0277 TaxID=2071994 RepID=UPI000D0341E1|nr:DUF2254 domain-containing protein [Corynebacterium sp. 13CS0277]PRQ11299.1 DUF2254 domain-containing protein [Corynebacterium sp. 13CS0277]
MQKFRHGAKQVTDAFWFVPAALVACSVALAVALIWAERSAGEPEWLRFVYGGGESGARSLLGAVASASIGVAGTVFSITIAALSSVVSTMGPRLLHGFLADRGIQATLGIFVATFAFCLVSLRAISGDFVPHYNVTVAMLYAAACVGFLVYCIGHMARSISMTRVVNLLARDLDRAIDAATEEAAGEKAPAGYFLGAREVRAPRGGYVQSIDYQALGRAAAAAGAAVELLVHPGDHVLTGSIIARVKGEGEEFVHRAMIVGSSRDDTQDLEFSVRQLLEVGVRALSPGTNDPFTAMDVIDRFAEALARLGARPLPVGVVVVDGVLRVQYTVTTFEGLVDVMFHQLRQNAAGTTAVYLRLLEAFASVAAVVDIPARRDYLAAHGRLVWEDARREVANAADLADIEGRYENLLRCSTARNTM